MFRLPNKKERNRTVARFVHNGKHYRIHERTSYCSDGSRYTRRFIVDDKGDWITEANNVKMARKVLAEID